MTESPEKEAQPVRTVIDAVRGRDIEVITARSDAGAPGLGWRLSAETERALEKIDDDLRAASDTVGRAMIGASRS